MPQAVPIFVGAAIGAISFAAKGVFWAIFGAVLGAGLVGLQMLLTPSASVGQVDLPSTETTDTGLGFQPVPNYGSSEAPVPLVYGRTMVTGQLLDQLAYGTNLRRAYIVLGFGEGPLTIHNIYLDGVPISRLSNYREQPGGSDGSWYVPLALGSQYVGWVSNTGTIHWGAQGTESAPCNAGQCQLYVWPFNTWLPPMPDPEVAPMVVGPPVTIYGSSGKIKIYVQFHQNKTNLCCWFRLGLRNRQNPGQIIWGTDPDALELDPTGFGVHLLLKTRMQNYEGWAYINFGDVYENVRMAFGNTVWYTFNDVPGDRAQYEPLIQYCFSAARENENRARLILDRIEVEDPGGQFTARYWGTGVAVVHLALPGGSQGQPTISALVSGFGILPGDIYGSPPICAYHLLTGRLSPTSEQTGLTCAVPPEFVDWESVQETVRFCRALNAGQGYWFNRAYGASTDLGKMLTEVCTAGRFLICRDGDKLRFVPDQDGPVVYAISEAEEIAPESLAYGRGTLRAPEVMEGQYVDQDLLYTVQRVIVEIPHEQQRLGTREQVDLTGVTDQTQAYELTRYLLNTRRLNQHWCTCQVGYNTARMLRVGDLIQIDTAQQVVASRTWRIVELAQKGEYYQLSLVEHNPAVYTSRLNYCDGYGAAGYGQEAWGAPSTAEGGYVSYSPWVEDFDDISVYDLGAPETGPSRVYNLVVTSITYLSGSTTKVEFTLTVNPERCHSVRISYAYGNVDSWTVAVAALSPTAGGGSFNVELRWGMLVVRAEAYYDGRYGLPSDYPAYVAGTGNDYPGYGKGQFGWQQYGE